jgi:hypothetical protein
MKKALAFVLLTFGLALLLPSAATAQTCSATQTCNDACWLEMTCSKPYPPCELFCSASSRSVSCSGASSCSVGTNSVTCDGVTKTCPTTSQCVQGGTYVRCGSFTRQCTYNCPL